jgi:hypothetical protein
MVDRAQALIDERARFPVATLCLATACGPRQEVLRPAELEDQALARDLHREVLLGDDALFEETEGVQTRIEGDALILEQRLASLLVDSLGSVRLAWPATDQGGAGLPALIEEEVAEQLSRSFRLTAWILDRIDHVRRLTHVSTAVGLLSATYVGWRTRAEHAASPSSMTMPMNVRDREVATLAPAVRPRGALTYEVPQLTEDFLALLRRRYRS